MCGFINPNCQAEFLPKQNSCPLIISPIQSEQIYSVLENEPSLAFQIPEFISVFETVSSAFPHFPE